MKTLWIVIVAIVALAAGCNDNKLGIDKKYPNRPPETILSSGPPDSIGPGGPRGDAPGTPYRVHLFWSGSDRDGTIDHYDFIMIDHPASDARIGPDSCGVNTVCVEVPKPADPRWTGTTANDSLFVTKADTLRVRPNPGGGDEPFVRRQSFERWHTFFVRAVDNEGTPDPSPEYRSFNSTTLAPTVALKSPVVAGTPFDGPPVIIFNWDGEDPVGDGNTQPPIASRWVLITSCKNSEQLFVGWPDSLYNLAPSRWSPWIRWDAADKSGVRAIVKNLQLTGRGEGCPPQDPRGRTGYYIFAVQAMDEAGAVTPVFDYQTVGRNNATLIQVSGAIGPDLFVDDKFLGQFTFAAGARPVVQDIAAGQPVRFHWRGDASRYGGEIVAYRYGWNIRNPSNDEEWEQGWSATATTAPIRVFNSGTQRFFLETRDNAETITHAEFELVVHQVTRNLDLLLVDDTLQPNGELDERERLEDQAWRRVVDSLLVRRPTWGFDAVRDIYDVQEPINHGSPPPLGKVFDYKTVVWYTLPNRGPALRQLALFFDPFAERNKNRVQPFNFLNIFIDNKGELWVSGEQPAIEIWPPVNGDNNGVPIADQLPVNVTNWDDPPIGHPANDSAGIGSLLYKMGIEAFDVGAGGQWPPRRSDLKQYCIGVRRAAPQGYERQIFLSSNVESHTHSLTVPSSDVDRAPAAGATYATDVQADHRHDVILTQAQFQSLQRGETVTVTSADARTTTGVLHHHEFSLVDKVGLWGAPPVLEIEASLWPIPPDPVINPLRARPNIEIYNMESFLAQPTGGIALNPPRGRTVALYSYVSGVPADSAANVLFPNTADGQPVFLLTRSAVTDPNYSRAWSSFEPYLLKFDSHLRLAHFILLRHFRLGLPEE